MSAVLLLAKVSPLFTSGLRAASFQQVALDGHLFSLPCPVHMWHWDLCGSGPASQEALASGGCFLSCEATRARPAGRAGGRRASSAGRSSLTSVHSLFSCVS